MSVCGIMYNKLDYLKKMFEGCHLQPSQRELADKTKTWPDKKNIYTYFNIIRNLPNSLYFGRLLPFRRLCTSTKDRMKQNSLCLQSTKEIVMK
jgi:hypothetical protein